MDKLLKFKEWMEADSLLPEGSNPGAKTALYPLSYGGIGLYPPQWYPTRSADAIYYASIDDRLFKSKDDNIGHIPGRCPEKMGRGDRGPWDIRHLKGRPTHIQGRDMACKPGEGPMWDIRHIREAEESSIPDMISQETGVSRDEVMNMSTEDLSSEMRKKIKNLGVVKRKEDGMGEYGRIVRIIDDGIRISDLVEIIGD